MPEIVQVVEAPASDANNFRPASFKRPHGERLRFASKEGCGVASADASIRENPDADLPTIQRISGQKTLAMVLRYAHVSGAHIDAAMAALERKIHEPAAENQNGTAT